MAESYPLTWPDGWRRIPPSRRIPSQFKKTTEVVRKFLFRQIGALGGSKIIISTNVPTRLDGLFYARAREPEDPGIAVYFEYREKPMCFACDQYRSMRENLHSIALTIEALRGIKRWGASDMMERAFRGFAALPAASWRTVLGVGMDATLAEAEKAFRIRAHEGRSDKGGSADMGELVRARDEARKELAR